MSDRNALEPGRPWLRHRLSLGCLAAVALVWSAAALLPGTSDGDRRETLFGVGAGILTAVMAFEAFLRWSRRRGGGTLSRAVDGGGDERDRALWGRAWALVGLIALPGSLLVQALGAFDLPVEGGVTALVWVQIIALYGGLLYFGRRM